MKWYEYIILIVAIGLVVLPFILKYFNKKGKTSCGCECSSCGKDCPLKEKKNILKN
ncbi:MAG: FeoB-associated Cys-rich membrane protein [Bacilli bacterium]